LGHGSQAGHPLNSFGFPALETALADILKK
jgi:hypothetical protein